MSEPVLYAVDGGVATITLNRPDAMNGLDVPSKVALRDAVLRAAGDDDVRVVVLAGSGRAFCVGQDLKEHIGLLRSGDTGTLFSTVEEHYNPTVTALLTMAKPVVAAVNGVAAGAGASLALACDFRVLVDTAGFNFAFAGVGLSCDTGVSWTLPRIVGRAKATELLYFPRTVDASESLTLGLATSVVPADGFEPAVTELAGKLAAGPTLAYGAMKRAMNTSATSELPEALAFEGRMMNLTGATEDHHRAVESFVAKEKPVFSGR
ncbi:MAG TPA: enoyl-CoA hydratase-related protein [Nocardioidaceae bacterium]|nr:enoyl-CoA hydratase-related protein [Nocardioidaceae bacterium]